MSHTPEPWRAEWQPGQTPKHTYTHCVMCGDDSLCDTLTKADACRIVACVNALAGVEKPAEEISRLRQIEKQWHEDQMRARADAKATRAVLEATGLEVLGWSVNCPSGHEHDTLLFGDGDDAHEQAEVFNSDYPEGESPHVAVPLYAIDPAQVARWRAIEDALKNAITWEGRLNQAEQMLMQGDREEWKKLKLRVQYEMDLARHILAAKGGE